LVSTVRASAIICVGLTSALACVLLVVYCLGHDVANPYSFVAAGVVAFLVGLPRTRVSDHATLSLGFAVTFWMLIHLGPQAAIAAAALNGVAVILAPKVKHPLSVVVGIHAVATFTVAAAVSSWVYVLAGGVPGATGVWGMAVPALAAAAAYHLANCCLVALVGGLASGESVWRLFCGHFGVAGFSYYAGGGMAVLTHLTWQVAGAWPLLAALPILYVFQLAFRNVRPNALVEQA
jgi:hypothetical protein